MKRLLGIHALITVCGAVLVFALVGRPVAELFAIGSTLVGLNLTVHVIVWPRILMKKQVAMSIGVIVIKFLILGWIIYVINTQTCAGDLFKLAWFGAGLSTVVVSVFAAAAIELIKPTTKIKSHFSGHSSVDI